MSNAFTLDDIRAAAEKKYGHVDVTLSSGENVRLLNALQLPKEKRAKLIDLQGKLGEDDADQEGLLTDCLRAVAENAELVEKLIGEVGDNLAVLIQIFASYNGETEAGEA